MKIKLKKLRHIWTDEKGAHWNPDKFDKEVLNELKEKYDNLFDKKIPYLIVNSKTVFLYYRLQDDFIERVTKEISVLVADGVLKSTDSIHKYIDQNITDVFDDTSEYNIEVDDRFVKSSKLNNIIIVTVSFFLLLGMVGLWFNSENNDTKCPVTIPAKSNLPSGINVGNKKPDLLDTNKSLAIEQSVAEEHMSVDSANNNPIAKEEKKKWQWKKFCKENDLKNPDKCYKLYIEKKCQKKYKFRQSYIEFINSDTERKCKSLKGVSKIRDDINLQDAHLDSNFFKGEKGNAK